MHKPISYTDEAQKPEVSQTAQEPAPMPYAAEPRQAERPAVKARPRRWLTDEELEEKLKGLPAWDEVEHPDLSTLTREDYNHAMRKMARRPMPGIEKWL